MEIKDRIQKFLEIENINPSKFAEEVGIQRSAISHILSGRNNPSLEVIQKILKRFSYINAEWLILGKGEMFKQEREPTLFDSLLLKETNNNQNQEIKKEDINNTSFSNNEETMQNIQKEKKENARIVKIIVLYDNGKAEVFNV